MSLFIFSVPASSLLVPFGFLFQHSTEIIEFDSSWTPQWANAITVWHLNEVSISATVADSSSAGNTGIVVSTTLGTTGKINTAATFAASGYIYGINLVNMARGSFSLWIEIAAYPISKMRIAGLVNGDGDGTHDKEFFMNTSGQVEFYAYDGGEKSTSLTSALPLNTWVHLAATVDGTTMVIYVNGVSAGSVSAGDTYAGYWSPNVYLGGSSGSATGGTYFNGIADEFAVWNVALTAAEIFTIYNKQVPGL